MPRPLNTADWHRIEAAIRDMSARTAWDPAGVAYARTLDKVESINLTGKYTLQRKGI